MSKDPTTFIIHLKIKLIYTHYHLVESKDGVREGVFDYTYFYP